MMSGINYHSLLLLILSLSTLALSTFLYRRRSARKTPTPQSYPLIGNLIAFLRNRHRFHDWLTHTLSTTPSLTLKVHGFLGRPHRIVTANNKNLTHILRSNFHNYIKTTHYTSAMQELLGYGILNSSSTLWHSEQTVTSQMLISKTLKAFTSDTVQRQLANSLIPTLSAAVDCTCINHDTIDLQQVLRRFCFDNMCKLVFGVNLLTSGLREPRYLVFAQAFYDVLEHASDRLMSPVPAVWKVKRFFNVGSERTYKKAMHTVNEFVMDVIKWKETQDRYKDSEDLLSKFMVASWNLGLVGEQRMEFSRDMAVNFLYLGKDSTSIALTWFFWLLDGHPHCKHLIHKELSKLMASSHHVHPPNLTIDDLNYLNYLHAALSESMRLFPPLPINSRLTVKDDILPDGTYVKQGWSVDYSTYAMGRMKNIWGSDCREFKPERWLDENGEYRPTSPLQSKFAVFSRGNRLCLGKEVAYLQMMAVVVAVMYKFEIEVVGGGGTPDRMADPPYSSRSGFLIMENGLHVRVKKRQQSKDTRGLVLTLFGMFLVGLSFYKHKQNGVTK